MPKYLIKREIPGAGRMNAEELKAASQQSCGALRQIGSDIQWVHSYVTDDSIHCVYIAPNADRIREHARISGFPANQIMQVETVIDPTTAEVREPSVS